MMAYDVYTGVHLIAFVRYYLGSVLIGACGWHMGEYVGTPSSQLDRTGGSTWEVKPFSSGYIALYL
jgi:hypothetical protein